MDCAIVRTVLQGTYKYLDAVQYASSSSCMVTLFQLTKLARDMQNSRCQIQASPICAEGLTARYAGLLNQLYIDHLQLCLIGSEAETPRHMFLAAALIC